MTGTERFSARDTTLGRSQGSRTMGSKKVEWGAATRTGAWRREARWPRTRIRRKPSRKKSTRLRPSTPLWHTVLQGKVGRQWRQRIWASLTPKPKFRLSSYAESLLTLFGLQKYALVILVSFATLILRNLHCSAQFNEIWTELFRKKKVNAQLLNICIRPSDFLKFVGLLKNN